MAESTSKKIDWTVVWFMWDPVRFAVDMNAVVLSLRNELLLMSYDWSNCWPPAETDFSRTFAEH